MLATKSSEMMGMGKPLTAKGFQVNTAEDNAHLDAFLAAAHRRKYPAKSTLIYAGDKSDSIYFILKGSVTVLVEDESGREIIVAYLNKGDFFALFEDLNALRLRFLSWHRSYSQAGARIEGEFALHLPIQLLGLVAFRWRQHDL